jgi:hypothetical protein
MRENQIRPKQASEDVAHSLEITGAKQRLGGQRSCQVRRADWKMQKRRGSTPQSLFEALAFTTFATEMAEAGAPDATIMAVAGHLDRAMTEHYGHVRMAAKRDALGRKRADRACGCSSTTSSPKNSTEGI